MILKKHEDYLRLFNTDSTQGDNEEKSDLSMQEKALDRAWKNRDFEIEMYWKRATYFWAFTAATFTGYILVLRFHQNISVPNIELLIAAMGLIFAMAWYLVNKGSKKWQENWEKHIDLLEDEITGPIYKTVLRRKAPSVSRVNMKVSLFVTFVWGYLVLNHIFPVSETVFSLNIDFGKSLIILLLLYFILDVTGVIKFVKEKLLGKDNGVIFDKREIKYNPNNVE